MDEKYMEGNRVGVIEGLELAALYHDELANNRSDGAIFDEKENPLNGQAFYVQAHRRHASEIRKMKGGYVK